MRAHARQEYIVEEIKKKGGVKVEELAQQLDVSLMTIRRDLQHLSELGWVERCHGGAITRKEETYQKKLEVHREEKKLIARKAIEYVHHGDILFLDAGTTTFEMLDLLEDYADITIVTNDLEMGYRGSKKGMQMILTGGMVQNDIACMTGLITNHSLCNLKYDVAFMGAASVDAKYDVMTPSESKAMYKQLAISNSNYSYLLVDASKFNKKAMVKINNMKCYTGVITNYRFDEEELIRRKQIHIIQA
ncbi:MAG: DeoR/GlpR family DNA-binding transcription regulator [Lachnospiraceae bacterium]|nr:DeoR/GlpR family DNA-binding transcription regulator [Lachnospiraceae bacterium]